MMNEAEELRNATNTKLKGEFVKLASEIRSIPRVKTGLLSLDEHTGGGLPMGGPISIQGRKSVGKSAFCYYMAGRAIEQYGGVGMLIQTEGGFVPAWAELCGLPPCDFVPLLEADKLQETLEAILEILRNNSPTYVILDSLSMLARDPDKSLLESESHGGRAKPINAFFRNLLSAMDEEHPPLFLYIEHLHPDMNSRFGGLTTTGGETKGYANIMEIRLQMDVMDKRDIETMAGKQNLPVNQPVVWEIRKSKVSPTRGKGRYVLGLRDTQWSKAGEISDFDELLAVAVYNKHIKKAGSWYEIVESGEKYQGAEKLKAEVGSSVIKELALRPRAEGGAKNSKLTRLQTETPKRGRKPKGGHGGGGVDGEQVPGGAQDSDGPAGDPDVGMAPEDNEGSPE